MAKIKMLPPETVDLIAAGEVILRPVSVVKELVENAIDAGARRIEIHIKEGGIKEIEIIDDGSGIPYNELPLAFQRHATSKITFAEDLSSVRSLGFRGEALSSVAACAQVVMTTRFKEEEIGSEIALSGGRCLSHHVVPWDRGTRITVRDLFSQIPARQKYLKKAEEEERVIRETVDALTLSHPEIAFSYFKDGKQQIGSSGNGELKAAAASVFGSALSQSFLPIDEDCAPIRLTGLIGDLTLRRSHRGFQRFFVNGRLVKNPSLVRAYEECWEGMLMKHQYPAGILYLDIPPKMLDINVHPQKTQIRLLNESLSILLFKQGVRDALKKLQLIAKPQFEVDEPVWESRANNPSPMSQESILPIFRKEEIDYSNLQDKRVSLVSEPVPESESGSSVLTIEGDEIVEVGVKSELSKRLRSNNVDETIDLEDHQTALADDPLERIRASFPEQGYLERPAFSKMKRRGVLFDTYILLEEGKNLFLIDQHAAHEATLFELYRSQCFKKTGFPAQELLLAQSVPASKQECLLLTRFEKEVLSFGFDAEVFGEDCILVRSVPILLGTTQEAELLLSLLALFDDTRDPKEGLERIISMSCKRAVKAGDRLTESEITELLVRLEGLDNPYTCPHGRPVITRLSEYELRKLFKRIV